MNRRFFIQASGIATLILPFASSAMRAESDHNDRQAIERSVKADLGAGFTLSDHYEIDGAHYANAVHLGNHFTIRSSDGRRWAIVSSSVR